MVSSDFLGLLLLMWSLHPQCELEGMIIGSLVLICCRGRGRGLSEGWETQPVSSFQPEVLAGALSLPMRY